MEYYTPFEKDVSHKPFGEISSIENDYFVDGKLVENNRAISGDIVYLDELREKVIGINDRFQGFIVGILHLNNNQKYGFTKKNVPFIKFTSLSGKYPNYIVPSKSKEKRAMYCVIKFNKWETNNKHPIGQIEYLLGPVGDMDCEIEALLFKTNVYPRKSKFKYLELNSLDEECIDYKTFSIDPIGCKDIDDAIHYKELYDGKIEIGIHIANVSRFVDSWDTNFFSSVYLKKRQINMLDESHSFGKCSLGHGEKKRALSLILKFNGYILEGYEFKETIIKNNALSYQDVEKMISDCSGGAVYKLWEFTSMMKSSLELSATKMVEYYMLFYNKCVAETLYKYDSQTILRTHKVIKTDLEVSDERFESYLHRINQNAAEYQIDPKETWHQDLEMEFYTHATSPIRRYVDIINQKNIINYLANREIVVEQHLEKINLFQKNLRKFYNHHKKLDIIFSMDLVTEYKAFIVGVEGLKISIYIPDLDIEHSFLGISRKLLDCNQVVMDEDYLEINGVRLGKMAQLFIKLTQLPFEEKFNKKLHIQILNPEIILL
jgi:exoribonuclease R